MNNATHKVTPAAVVGGATDGFPIVLNYRWRVVDDPVQWILQRRRGRNMPASRSAPGEYQWSGRSFTTLATVLKREIRRLCGEVDAEVMKLINRLPEKHPGFVAHVEKNMAQYRKENPRAGRGRARASDLKGVPVPCRG